MLGIQRGPFGEVVMAGRLDATQCEAALGFLKAQIHGISRYPGFEQIIDMTPGSG
jgi:hypothetical protein